MKRQATIVKDLNKIFPEYSKGHPVAFVVDNQAKVTSGCSAKETIMVDGKPEEFEVQVVDYYGEFWGGYPWIHEKLQAYLDDNGLFAEWENPEAIAIYNA